MTETSRRKEPWNRGPWGYVQPWDVKAQGPTILDPRETSYYSPEELHQAFDGLVEDPQNLEWKGIELFWGRKPDR